MCDLDGALGEHTSHMPHSSSPTRSGFRSCVCCSWSRLSKAKRQGAPWTPLSDRQTLSVDLIGGWPVQFLATSVTVWSPSVVGKHNHSRMLSTDILPQGVERLDEWQLVTPSHLRKTGAWFERSVISTNRPHIGNAWHNNPIHNSSSPREELWLLDNSEPFIPYSS